MRLYRLIRLVGPSAVVASGFAFAGGCGTETQSTGAAKATSQADKALSAEGRRSLARPVTAADRAAVRHAKLIVSHRGQEPGPAYLVRGDGRRRRLRNSTSAVRLAPDGRHIGFLEATGRKTRRYGEVLQLVTSRLDGSDRVVFRTPRALSHTLSADDYGWSPDGQTLAVGFSDLDDSVFSGAPLSGRYVLGRRDGSRLRILIRCEVGNGPAFAPDGKRVAVACLYGPTETAPVTGPQRPLDNPGESSGQASGGALAWRPDGLAIATAIEDGRTEEIAIRTEPGGRVIRRIPHAHGFAWSPDGRYYAYTPSYGYRPGVTIARARDGRRLHFVALGSDRPATALIVQWAS